MWDTLPCHHFLADISSLRATACFLLAQPTIQSFLLAVFLHMRLCPSLTTHAPLASGLWHCTLILAPAALSLSLNTEAHVYATRSAGSAGLAAAGSHSRPLPSAIRWRFALRSCSLAACQPEPGSRRTVSHSLTFCGPCSLAASHSLAAVSRTVSQSLAVCGLAVLPLANRAAEQQPGSSRTVSHSLAVCGLVVLYFALT